MRDIVSPLSGFGSPFGQRRRTFTPAVLFAASEPGVWLDPSDPAALFSDTAGTTQAGIVDPVAAARLLNDDTLAVQATLASRPILGRVPATGRRNRLMHTEDLDDVYWAKLGITVSRISNATWAITEGTGNEAHQLRRTGNLLVPDGMYRNSVEVKAGIRTRIALNFRSSDVNFAHSQGALFDLSNGTVISNGSLNASIEPLADGWFRISVLRDVSGTGTRTWNLVLAPDSATDHGSDSQHTYAGDSSAPAVFIRHPQSESGSVVTPYQRVGSEFDITEAGVPSLRYLGDPGAASLPATVPDLGTNATLAYATEAGVTILTGQTIGAGALEILRGDRTHGLIANNRPWTAAETAGVTKWLNARIPA